MTSLLTLVPLLAALAAAPALAAPPDEHADHAAAAATTGAKLADMAGCPMMAGSMTGAQKGAAGKPVDGKAAMAARHKAMMDGKPMHCMAAPPAAPAAPAPDHDHQHPPK